jgi:hypothetical protein
MTPVTSNHVKLDMSSEAFGELRKSNDLLLTDTSDSMAGDGFLARS